MGNHEHFLLFRVVLDGRDAAFGLGHRVRPNPVDIEQSFFGCGPRRFDTIEQLVLVKMAEGGH